jgi:hypothetical protein
MVDNEGLYPALDSEEEYSFMQKHLITDDRRKYFQSLF